MNLALLTQDFPPEIGGIETYATELAKRFYKDCDEFLLIAPDKPNADEVDNDLPYSVQRMSSSNSFLGFAGMFEVPPLLAKKNIRTAFHTQWQTLPISVYARQVGSVDSIFVAAHARELLFNPFSSVPLLRESYENYKRWLLSKVDLFFPVSDYTADLLRMHKVPDERIQVVINGTDPNAFYPKNVQDIRKNMKIETANVLLTISRLVPRKGIDTVIKAFQLVLKKHANSKYIIVGDGEYKAEFKALADRLGLTDSIIFMGEVKFEKLIDFYNTCDVFVMPSKTTPPNVEGFGIVFLEANACGKPVIGTFSGGIPSAILNEETGLLIEEQQPEKLAIAINKLFSNPKLARKLGGNGRRYVEQTANWNASVDVLMNFMRDNC